MGALFHLSRSARMPVVRMKPRVGCLGVLGLVVGTVSNALGIRYVKIPQNGGETNKRLKANRNFREWLISLEGHNLSSVGRE